MTKHYDIKLNKNANKYNKQSLNQTNKICLPFYSIIEFYDVYNQVGQISFCKWYQSNIAYRMVITGWALKSNITNITQYVEGTVSAFMPRT